MIDMVTTDHYIFPSCLVLVFLDRIRLLFFIMGPAQVLTDLAEFDAFTTGLIFFWEWENGFSYLSLSSPKLFNKSYRISKI
jgi:hypothetical protein